MLINFTTLELEMIFNALSAHVVKQQYEDQTEMINLTMRIAADLIERYKEESNERKTKLH